MSMLRQASILGLRQASRLKQSPALSRALLLDGRQHAVSRQVLPPVFSNIGLRPLSSQKEKATDGDEETKEIVLTPGQKVAAASRVTMWAGIFGFACACAYFIGKELFPTKMSPNSVFNKASKTIQNNSQVTLKYGTSLKFYGKDHGGHREGRRNFIEHTEYQDPDDGSNRTRVRFNMEGQFDSAICFAEVSSDLASGEFVYVLVQDKRSGRVITVMDNRAAITSKRLAGGNQETANAMQQLLGRGSSGN
eukprot:CAMPEP_0116135052 /NCGR_PEP_ID=MMETSP0329-20121206/10985_1 /TAXON_ID=697910 /ORGANISM="Pseudo-nitzschia arenysensis, Strain B593" /LENGTH=249 /DNA_ID=CAMNT_0003629827 /DNA_START=121 /DNA_END=870 /DNA_ORIENTATION=-